VGKYYLEDPHFVVFRIDGTKNDVVHPKSRVVGYPTLYFFVGGDKGNPIEYDGDRTVEAIVDFIQNFRTAYAEVDESVTETEAVEVSAAVEGGTEGATEDLAARALAASESQESEGVVSTEQERKESQDDAGESFAAGGADTRGVLAEEL
jgi:L-lactate utilization protein LutC